MGRLLWCLVCLFMTIVSLVGFVTGHGDTAQIIWLFGGIIWGFNTGMSIGWLVDA